MNVDSLCNRPLKLKYTRITRNYTGGLLMEQFQNSPAASDGNMPEEWIASTVDARTDNYKENDGLSLVEIDEGKEAFLRDLINSKPEAFLGIDHVNKYSTDTAVLVKLIDSCSRLYLQVHPDRGYSKEVFGSNFGKTEAWYILGGRSINGEEPYVLLGFKEGITKEIWKQLFESQDKEGMISWIHRFPVKPGDIYYIESGVPHAIGSGCFLIEVQEPTDYTFRVERTTPEGRPLPDSFCHQGVGFEKMLDAFHYNGFSKEDILEKFCLQPSVMEVQDGGSRLSIVSSPYFDMQKLSVAGSFSDKKEDIFSVAVVISGNGKLLWPNGEINIQQADQLYLPAKLTDMVWQSNSNEKLEIILSYPPR